jgi:FMN phosphatase YigB (HAD superfamily)
LISGQDTKVIVFDLDGTLVSLLPDEVIPFVFDMIRNTLNIDRAHFIQVHGEALKAWKLIKRDYPGRTRYVKLWEIVFEKLGVPKCQLHSFAYRIQGEVEKTRDQIYPDARPVIEHLARAGYTIGILSERQREGIESSLTRHGLCPYVTFCLSANGPDRIGGKRNPKVWQQVLSLSMHPPQEICYVSDEYEYDIREAADFGLNSVLIDRSGRAYAPLDRRISRINGLEELTCLLSQGPPRTIRRRPRTMLVDR